MWALDFLGLDTSADEKAIKRAYAKLLKITRPDDDPEAFQKLNEAYQAALAWQKNNTRLDDEDVFYNELTNAPVTYTETSEPETTNDETPSIEKIPALHHFYKQCMQIIANNNPDELKSWLTDNSFLSEVEPQAITALFLNHWQKYLPPVSIECFIVVDELFQLNNNDLGDRLNAIWKNQHPIESDNNSYLNNKRERVNPHNFVKDSQPDEQPEFYLFYKQCMQIIAKNNPDELKNWLTDHGFLSEIEPQAITALFLNHWQKYLPPVSVECFKVIDELFQLNNIELQNTLNIIWQSKQQVATDYDEIATLAILDSKELFQQCINVARQGMPNTLRLWLNTQPQLWSIDNKQQFKDYLINTLLENPIGLSKHCFSVILDFFDLNSVQDSLNYETIHNLQNRLHGLWLFEPQHIADLKSQHKPIARFSSLSPEIENNWQLLEQLQKPFSWPQAFFASLPTSRAKRWGQSLRQLLERIDNQTPHSICQKQLNFWLSFNQKGLHTIKLIRWTVINLILLLLTAYPVILCVAYFNSKISTSLFNALSAGISVYAIPFFTLAAINLTALMIIWYYLWIRIPYYAIKNPDLRSITIAFTPCLCVISAILFLNNSLYSLASLLLAIFNSSISFEQANDDEEATEEDTSYVNRFLRTISVFFVVLFVIVFRSPLLYCILGYVGIRIAYNLYTSNIFQGVDINILAIIDIGSISSLIYWISLIATFVIWLGAYETQKTKHKQTLSS